MTRKMKDSGIEWIGEIPQDWGIVKAKYLFNKMDRPIKVEETVTAFRDGQVVQRKKRRTDGFTNSLKEIGYQGVRQGDLVIHSMDAFSGAIGISEDDGKCSPVCIILDKKHDNVHNPYFSYLMRVYSNLGYIESMAKGIRVRSSDFKYQTFADTLLLVPTIEEQKSIINHIIVQTSCIDKLITETKQSIGELKKYKQSLITEAVTKGLDPNVEMKDSGIEWIGEIPDHWNFVKLGNISTKIGSGKTPRGGEDVYSQTGIYFLRSQNIYNEGLSLDTVRYITNDIHDEMSNTKVQHKDILLNITGGSIGRATIYDLIEEANVNQHVCIIRPNQDLVSSEWIHYCLISFLGIYYVNYFQTGGNREGLNFGEIAKFRIPLPKIEEQKIVSKRLKEQTTRIDKLIEDKTKVIEELEEYKKSLIYEYVTGKKEV